MDISAIGELIGTLGFPIAMCVYMAYSNNKLNEQHRESEAKLTEIINNNTVALTKLSDKIDHLERLNNVTREG